MANKQCLGPRYLSGIVKYKEVDNWEEKPHSRWPTSQKKGNVRQMQKNLNDRFPVEVRELQ
jgi:hypothetical protein